MVYVLDSLKKLGFEAEHSEFVMSSSTSIELDLVGAEKLLRMVDFLEDLDDVQNVYTNADVNDEILEQL